MILLPKLIYHIVISKNSSGIFLGFQIIFDSLTISEVQSLLWPLIESIEGADIIPNAESTNCEMFLKKNLFAAFWLFIIVVAILKLIKLRETERVFTEIVQKNRERNGQSFIWETYILHENHLICIWFNELLSLQLSSNQQSATDGYEIFCYKRGGGELM